MEVSFCQTISYNVSNFDYETISQVSGNAGIIKFKLDHKENSPGDVVVVLDDSEIIFHGVIGKIEDGYAFASDMTGSLLPANTVQ
jgi:hypothetical protein